MFSLLVADEICICGNTDSKDSIEFVDNYAIADIPTTKDGFDINIVEPVGHILSKEALDEILDNKGLFNRIV